MAELTKKKFQEWGRKGGNKTKSLGKEHYSKIGKAGAKARWGKGNAGSKLKTNKK